MQKNVMVTSTKNLVMQSIGPCSLFEGLVRGRADYKVVEHIDPGYGGKRSMMGLEKIEEIGEMKNWRN